MAPLVDIVTEEDIRPECSGIGAIPAFDNVQALVDLAPECSVYRYRHSMDVLQTRHQLESEQTAESKRHFRLPVAIRVLLLHLHFGGLGLHPLFSKR